MIIGTGVVTFGGVEIDLVGFMESDPVLVGDVFDAGEPVKEVRDYIENYDRISLERLSQEFSVRKGIDYTAEGWSIFEQFRAQDIFNGVYEEYRRRG